MVPILVGVVILVLLGIIAVLALVDDPQPPEAAPGTGDRTTSATPRPTPSSTEPPTSEPTTPEPVSARDIEAFTAGYIATASSDVRAGFQQLTPQFQAESGGLSGYRGFWGDVTSTRMIDVEADPRALTVTYTYAFTKDGAGETTDTVTLQLEQDGDRLLIAGEA